MSKESERERASEREGGGGSIPILGAILETKLLFRRRVAIRDIFGKLSTLLISLSDKSMQSNLSSSTPMFSMAGIFSPRRYTSLSKRGFM